MNKKTYEMLMDKLDETSFKIQVSHPVPGPAESPRSVGLILTKETDVSVIPDKQLPLAHTLLHQFYSKNSGRGLSKKDIERLHSDIVPLLHNHIKFDRLDRK